MSSASSRSGAGGSVNSGLVLGTVRNELAFPLEGSWQTVGVRVRQEMAGGVTAEIVSPDAPSPGLVAEVRDGPTWGGSRGAWGRVERVEVADRLQGRCLGQAGRVGVRAGHHGGEPEYGGRVGAAGLSRRERRRRASPAAPPEACRDCPERRRCAQAA